uniref:SWIM-type domain-containing protein n=1 Tax=Amphimedon queenslandica TaxID=400682 RepID=A0A1X7V9P2_AMPQE
MLSYFIHRRALDGKPTNDFKDLNNKAFPLYKAGHIQNLVFKVNAFDRAILVKAQCRAEMKKNVVYNLRVSCDSGSSDITYATCGCPAGCGPTCAFKHLGALCYSMRRLSQWYQII